jgi:hypothetical protein
MLMLILQVIGPASMMEIWFEYKHPKSGIVWLLGYLIPRFIDYHDTLHNYEK